jgi:hypothetical protein
MQADARQARWPGRWREGCDRGQRDQEREADPVGGKEARRASDGVLADVAERAPAQHGREEEQEAGDDEEGVDDVPEHRPDHGSQGGSAGGRHDSRHPEEMDDDHADDRVGAKAVHDVELGTLVVRQARSGGPHGAASRGPQNTGDSV